MTYVLAILLVMMTSIAVAANSSAAAVGRSQEILNTQDQLMKQLELAPRTVRVKSIIIDGLPLQNSKKLQRMLAAYRNKYLSADQLDEIMKIVGDFYAQAGYSNRMVDISHTLKKGKLKVHVVLKKV